MPEPVRVLHYINQFFAGIGGEDKAGHPPETRDGAAGPGRLLDKVLGPDSVAATLICGDNFFQEQPEAAAAAVRAAIESVRPNVVIAGPAFVSGRYGLACGEVAKIAGELGVPAVAAMNADNPAASMYSGKVYVIGTGAKPVSMGPGLTLTARFAAKLAAGEPIGPAATEGYLPRGGRQVVTLDQPGYLRAVDMFVAKLNRRPFVTEIPYQAVDKVPPARPLADLTKATIALVTTGGLIRKGNPDKQTSSNARRYLRFDVTGMRELSSADFEADHAGYFTHTASDNPNYILPLSYARDLEERGEIGGVHETIYGMPGVGTPVAQCRELGQGIAAELRQHEVDACLLVST
jgi:glycine reductase complex component B subunit gamma